MKKYTQLTEKKGYTLGILIQVDKPRSKNFLLVAKGKGES